MAAQAVALVERPPVAARSKTTRWVEAATYYTLASEQIDTGNLGAGLTTFGRNVELLEEMLRENPTSTAVRHSLALTNKRMGALLGMNTRLDEAFDHYHRALALEEANLAEDPVSAPARRDISFTYSDLGWLLRKKGDSTAALESYRKVYEIRKALSDADPANTDMTWALSSTLSNMGAILGDRKEWAAAEARFRQAVALREELVRRDPANLGIADGVANNYADLGGLALHAGKFDEAVRQDERALVIVKDLSTRNPASRQYQYELGLFGANLGNAYVRAAETRRSAAERCGYAERARSLLAESRTRLVDMRDNGKLLEQELGALGLVDGYLAQDQKALAGCRAPAPAAGEDVMARQDAFSRA
jgi:tetratricopeptide (TPR) repeat protein